MKRSTLIIILLGIALVASNGWWAYQLLDAGVTQTYMGESLNANEEALAQTLSILPIVARPGVTRNEIIKAATPKGDKSEVFEKDGFVWVGKIGLKFDSKGQLLGVSKSWAQ